MRALIDGSSCEEPVHLSHNPDGSRSVMPKIAHAMGYVTVLPRFWELGCLLFMYNILGSCVVATKEPRPRSDFYECAMDAAAMRAYG